MNWPPMFPIFASFSKPRDRVCRSPVGSPSRAGSVATKRCLSGPEALSGFTREEGREELENETARCTLLLAWRIATRHPCSRGWPLHLVVALRNTLRRIVCSWSALWPSKSRRSIWRHHSRFPYHYCALHVVRGADFRARLRPARHWRPLWLCLDVSNRPYRACSSVVVAQIVKPRRTRASASLFTFRRFPDFALGAH